MAGGRKAERREGGWGKEVGWPIQDGPWSNDWRGVWGQKQIYKLLPSSTVIRNTRWSMSFTIHILSFSSFNFSTSACPGVVLESLFRASFSDTVIDCVCVVLYSSAFSTEGKRAANGFWDTCDECLSSMTIWFRWLRKTIEKLPLKCYYDYSGLKINKMIKSPFGD